MSADCRVAIYSQDSLGLGHLRRNIVIGATFLEAKKDSNVLLFADSPVAPFFKLPDRMDHVKLPSIRKVSAGCWEATSLRMDERELIGLRADLLCNGLKNFRPDVVLVDHMPGGAQGELIPALEALRRAHPACVIVLGLRDILDAPEVIQRVWETEGAYDALRRYYDRVLIYGSEELFGTCTTYRLPVPALGTHYCGYVVKQDPVRRANETRQALRRPKRRYVFVSAGGGGGGRVVMRPYPPAARPLWPQIHFPTPFAVGGEAPPPPFLVFEAQTPALPVPVRPPLYV